MEDIVMRICRGNDSGKKGFPEEITTIYLCDLAMELFCRGHGSEKHTYSLEYIKKRKLTRRSVESQAGLRQVRCGKIGLI
jgi:hypothetical protein